MYQRMKEKPKRKTKIAFLCRDSPSRVIETHSQASQPRTVGNRLLPLAAGALDMKAITMLHFFVGEMHSLRVRNGD